MWSVSDSFTNCCSYYTQLNRKDNQSHRHRQQPEGELSVSQKQPSLQLRLSVCILTICMFALRTISNSCNLHQWCPSRAQAYESDVLAAEQESSVPLEGALIYVMWLKLITPEPQSSIQEETVSLVLLWFLCPATVCKKWSCLLSRSWLRIPPNKDSVKQCVSVSLPEVTACLCVRFSLKRGLTRLKLKLFVALLLRLFWLGGFPPKLLQLFPAYNIQQNFY